MADCTEHDGKRSASARTGPGGHDEGDSVMADCTEHDGGIIKVALS